MTRSPSVDPTEEAKFRALADRWWDPGGPFKPLHDLNATRVALMIETLNRRWAREGAASLTGLQILDVGCGGGLAAEPLARLGAEVTGIDSVAENIAAARTHAATSGLAIDYRVETAEGLAASGRMFDVVIALEVIEHVADRDSFLKALGQLLKPGGLLLIATLNRTVKSFLFAIVGAERVLRLLPKGTHDWHKFPKPEEIHRVLAADGLIIERVQGLGYNPFRRPRWRVGSDTSVNYLLRASRPPLVDFGEPPAP